MDAEVGQWSARRRRVNERVARTQSSSVVIGHTSGMDDRWSIQDWTLVLMGRLGKAAQLATMLRVDAVPTDEDNPFEQEIVELTGLCHSFLESIDRRRSEQ
jgi:hypothetical protein